MEREVALAQGKSGVEDWISDHEAFVSAYSGQLARGQEVGDGARRTWLSKRASGTGRLWMKPALALWEGFFGNAPEARRSAMAARELSKSREVEYGAAFALALSGDSPGSQELANDLEKRYPEDTSVRFSYLPALRAVLALNHRRASEGDRTAASRDPL